MNGWILMLLGGLFRGSLRARLFICIISFVLFPLFGSLGAGRRGICDLGFSCGFASMFPDAFGVEGK